MTRYLLRENVCLASIERLQGDFGYQALPVQGAQKAEQWMPWQDLFQARRSQEQELCVWLMPQQIMEPLQGFLVAPLQVVQQQQQWLRRAEQRVCQSSKELLTLPAFGQGSRPREIRPSGQQLGYQARDFREPGS